MTERVRDKLGPYRILKILGEGGMGVVYLGEHETTGRRVAIKSLQAMQPGMAGAIRREIRSLAAITHPNIVQIYDDGVEDGIPWYAMQPVDGFSLSDFMHQAYATRALEHPAEQAQFEDRATGWWTSEQPNTGGHSTTTEDFLLTQTELKPSLLTADWRSMSGVITQICAGLSALHGAGLVHRDLKPENVLVCENKNVILVDFGISAVTGGLGREHASRQVGLVGTPGFMAPEQIHGGVVDARSDLYALGCILFELCTGSPPFVANHPFDLLRLHDSVPAPSAGKLAPDLPEELVRLIDRLLAKSPNERVGYAHDVDRMFRQILGLEPPSYEAPTYIYQPTLIGREHELELLKAWALELPEHGSRFAIAGEFGLGKTRLVNEALRALNRTTVIHVGSGSDVDFPFSSMTRIFQSVADFWQGPGVDLAAKLGPDAAVLASYSDELAVLLNIEPCEVYPDVSAGLEAIMRLFVVLTEMGPPVLVFLDDAHKLDSATLQWLSRQPPRGLGILVAFRPEEASPDVTALLTSFEVHLALPALDLDQVANLIGSMLAKSTIGREWIEYGYQHSRGIPLIVAELIRAAAMKGIIERDATGEWRASTQIIPDLWRNLPVSETLQAVLTEQLSGLTTPALRLARVASVFGEPVSGEILDEVAAPEARARDELIARDILREVSPGIFAFRTRRLGHAVYSTLPDGVKTRTHLRLAEHFAEKGDAVAAGRHFRSANDDAQAREWFYRAFEHEVDRGNFEAAVDFFLRGVELTSPDAVHRGLALVRKAWARGAYIRLLKLVDSLAEAALQLGERELYQTIRAEKLNIMAHRTDDPTEVQDLLKELEGYRDNPMVDAIYKNQTVTLTWNRPGFSEDALSGLQEAVDFFRRNDYPDHHEFALQDLVTAYRRLRQYGPALDLTEELAALCLTTGEIGLYSESVQAFERARDLAFKSNRKRLGCIAISNIANQHQIHGRYDLALEAIADCDRFAVYMDRDDVRGMLPLLRGEILASLGRFDEAEPLLKAAVAFFTTINSLWEFYSRVYLVRLYRRTARIDEAEPLLDELIAGAHQHDDPYLEIVLGAELGHVALARHRSADAHITQIQAVLEPLDVNATSELSMTVARLRRAQLAFETGHELLFGECREDVPVG